MCRVVVATTRERKTQTQAASHSHFIPRGAACCKEARLVAGQGKGDACGRGVLLQQAWAPRRGSAEPRPRGCSGWVTPWKELRGGGAWEKQALGSNCP